MKGSINEKVVGTFGHPENVDLYSRQLFALGTLRKASNITQQEEGEVWQLKQAGKNRDASISFQNFRKTMIFIPDFR